MTRVAMTLKNGSSDEAMITMVVCLPPRLRSVASLRPSPAIRSVGTHPIDRHQKWPRSAALLSVRSAAHPIEWAGDAGTGFGIS